MRKHRTRRIRVQALRYCLGSIYVRVRYYTEFYHGGHGVSLVPPCNAEALSSHCGRSSDMQYRRDCTSTTRYHMETRAQA